MGDKATLAVTRKSGEVSLKDLKSKKSGLVKVGVLTGMGKHPGSDSASFAEVASFIEYGTDGSGGRRGINEYAPFRTWLQEKSSEYKRLVKILITKYLKGEYTLKKVNSTLGLTGQKDLRDVMKNMKSPENEESTQLAKGRKVSKTGELKINNPTIDTGRLRAAMSWGVV